jgi:hypothetical protein
MKIHEIHEQVAALAPIYGVNSDGIVSFKPEATTEQRAAARARLDELLPSLSEAPVRVATARQFKAALAIAGVISEAEVTSPNLPAVAEPVVAAFPEAQRIVARSTWANMTVVPEDDPLLEAMRLAAGMTLEQKTALFDAALAIP